MKDKKPTMEDYDSHGREWLKALIILLMTINKTKEANKKQCNKT